MKLTLRLQTIADLIDSAQTVYDVGCDHAYLDIYLGNKGFNCVAIDVRKNVVDLAKENICKHGLENKVNVILNDGLKNIKIEQDDIIILSGLGTKTILNIIKNQPIRRLIIQSNDNLYLLRKSMANRNYFISDEKIVYEDNKYYVIIKFELGFKNYTESDLWLGPILLENKDINFIHYLTNMLNHFESVLGEIPQNYLEKRTEINNIINYIKMALQ